MDFGGGIVVEGIKNTSSHYDGKDIGGYEPQDTLSLLFISTDIKSAPNTLVGSVVLIDGISWRITRVKEGDAAVTIEFVSPDAS